MSRIFTTSFSSVYPLYVAKAERKGRTQAEVDEVIEWLTGFDGAQLNRHLEAGTTFEDFFADARLNPNASLITGSVCGVRVENVDDSLMQKIRYLDKLVDELAKGRPMARILRGDGSDPPARWLLAKAVRVLTGVPVHESVVVIAAIGSIGVVVCDHEAGK